MQGRCGGSRRENPMKEDQGKSRYWVMGFGVWSLGLESHHCAAQNGLQNLEVQASCGTELGGA